MTFNIQHSNQQKDKQHEKKAAESGADSLK